MWTSGDLLLLPVPLLDLLFNDVFCRRLLNSRSFRINDLLSPTSIGFHLILFKLDVFCKLVLGVCQSRWGLIIFLPTLLLNSFIGQFFSGCIILLFFDHAHSFLSGQLAYQHLPFLDGIRGFFGLLSLLSILLHFSLIWNLRGCCTHSFLSFITAIIFIIWIKTNLAEHLSKLDLIIRLVILRKCLSNLNQLLIHNRIPLCLMLIVRSLEHLQQIVL